jgi:queuine tRNA-ribosyltransferase
VRKFSFKNIHQDKKTQARIGVIHTPHGDIHTPAFVPVGTQGTVKSLTPHDLDTLGVQLYFVNTYHMYLRPGIDVVKKFGGLHAFMHWDHPLMTDSGGFQVFSLGRNKGKSPERHSFSSSAMCAKSEAGPAARFPPRTPTRGPLLGGPPACVTRNSSISGGDAENAMPTSGDTPTLVKISDEGVRFRSHWDGSPHLFTPELSMKWQWELGADIHMAFDDCTPFPVTHEKAQKSMERTHAWAARSLRAHTRLGRRQLPYQALYGVIQGSVYKDLRRESAKYICSLDFDGVAIGGVSVGEDKKQMKDVLEWVVPIIPKNKPRHLLGVGEIDDIFTLIEYGMDTFDCVQPTRLARMGHLFCCHSRAGGNLSSSRFTIDILKKMYANDVSPIDKKCACYTCTHFSRAYIHHLFRVRELLAYRLATIHNMYFIQELVSSIRKSIAEGTFLELKKQWL